MWQLLRKPRWIFLLVLAAGLGSLFVRLGFWQWHKYHARAQQNAAIAAGQRSAPVPIQTLLPRGSGDLGSAAFRRVTITGEYDGAHDLAVYGRTLNGEPGNEVVTPLVLPDGRVIIVNRGWIPFQGGEPDLTTSSPPTGSVHITGVLEPSETSGTPLPAGQLPQIAFIDLGELSSWLGRPVMPYWVHLQAQTPPPASFPRTVPLPAPDGGPYFGYALQWWCFAFVAFAGYPFLLHREARDRRRRLAVAAAHTGEGMPKDPGRLEGATKEEQHHARADPD
jgi:cytochrome oxidase assembly protein ShyY1